MKGGILGTKQLHSGMQIFISVTRKANCVCFISNELPKVQVKNVHKVCTEKWPLYLIEFPHLFQTHAGLAPQLTMLEDRGSHKSILIICICYEIWSQIISLTVRVQPLDE